MSCNLFSRKLTVILHALTFVLIDRADQDANCPDLSKLQKDAIDYLDEVCERPELQLRFTMQRGDILLLNN